MGHLPYLFGLISNTSNFIFYALAMPTYLKFFPHIIAISWSALPVLFVLPKRSCLLLANSPSSSNTHLWPYLSRNWPSTLDQVPSCVLKALHTYICTSNWAFVMTYIKCLSSSATNSCWLRHISYDLLILVCPGPKKNVCLPCRRLINVFGPNNLKAICKQDQKCVWGGGGRARAGRDKELALGHTDFAPDSFANKSPRK